VFPSKHLELTCFFSPRHFSESRKQNRLKQTILVDLHQSTIHLLGRKLHGSK
jgi:hypothetical protein